MSCMSELYGRSGEISEKKTESEVLFGFSEWGLDGQWLRISEAERSIEGAYYRTHSERSNSEVVIFYPGLPGSGVSWFEEKQTRHLLEAGFDVFVVRHAGLNFSEDTHSCSHNSIKEDSKEDTKEVSVSEWFEESEVALEFFSDKKIVFITHSFGSLAGGYALADLQKNGRNGVLKNIQKWISLGGVTYDLKDGGLLDEEKGITLEEWRKFFDRLAHSGFYSMGDQDQIMDEFENGLQFFNGNIANIPKDIQLVSVNADGDPYVSLESGRELQTRVRRGLVVDDRTANRKIGIDPHEFSHMSSETLLRLVKMNVSKYPHETRVSHNTAE